MPHDNFVVLVVLVPKGRPEKRVFLFGGRLTELASDLVLIVAAFDLGRGLFSAGSIREYRQRIVRLGAVFDSLCPLADRHLVGADGVTYIPSRTESFIRSAANTGSRHRLLFVTHNRVELLQRPFESALSVGHLTIATDLPTVAKDVLIGRIALSLPGISTLLTRVGLPFASR